ncbi:type II secretion system F family protein [Microbacterium imperiale]|uniref:Pilus assembly protein TadB n=1 Tax=Microbacterium imperiale TaxID=33884 RepID=A0A9W6HE82_9MICO|nr:type II secretion system F family protein [Microbacterium imperiale]MDS0198445.1 type II secretion system F family protein [Microbacterium imperiale]BFE40030.1 type II secretion system F family protein [Microbacterium imperiale]GLJ78995.1 pilus assembly protein TadB [Microbacterium imperiale]
MTAATDAAVSVLLGAAMAAGVLLMATRMPRWAAPTLARRIAPYVRDIADPRGLTPLEPVVPGAAGWMRGPRRWIEAVGDTASAQRLLRQAGWSVSVTGFRARQLFAGLVGLFGGAGAVVALAVAGQAWAGTALLPVATACGAVLASHLMLVAAARRRLRRIREDVPMVLEFLALCLAAGESLLDALRRVGEIGAGELTVQVRDAVLATTTGSMLTDALRDLARTADVASVGRAVDQLVAAIDRGAPLAQVLQAQAADAREDAKRGLIEQGGRKEILMLLPLVFLVLPLSVLFAVFPGIVMLRLGI